MEMDELDKIKEKQKAVNIAIDIVKDAFPEAEVISIEDNHEL